MKTIRYVQICVGIATVIVAQLSLAQVAVVASAKSTLPNLTHDQVGELFSGEAQTLPDGAKVNLLDQLDSAPVRSKFYGKVTSKSAPQIKAVWSRLTFSGKGHPPKEMASADEVKKTVNENTNTIGYIDKKDVDSSVKVLYTTD